MHINEQIRAREVRVIGDSGEQLGVLSLTEALRMARDKNLDLVEVAPGAVPPVCRLLDYGRFKYEQTRKEREARKNQKTVMVKEIRLTPKTDDHDLNFKTRAIQKFLEEGDKVKVSIRFKGREMAHPQLGRQLLDTIAKRLESTASIERTPVMEGRIMSIILSKSPTGAKKKAAEPQQEPRAEVTASQPA